MNNRDMHVVDLSRRYLSELPKETLENADHVFILDLSGNPYINLHTSLSRFSNLTTLQLNECNLRQVPEELCALKKLEKISLAANKQLETLCPSVDQLQSLRVLDISGCSLNSLPESLGNLHNLVKLNIAFNVQLEDLCSSLGQLKSLKELDVSRCRLKRLPDSVGELQNLESLRIADNYTLKYLSSSIGKLSSLRELDVSNCGLNQIPDTFWNMGNLEKLRIAHNNLLNCVSSSIAKLESLKEFDASDCGIEGLPETFWNLRNLEKLLMAGNFELESLSDTIGNLQSLKELDMSSCGLKSLPGALWNLHKLEKLRLAGNYELKDLSLSIGKLQSLKEIDVSNCGFGNLPKTLWDIQKLERLILQGDQQLACFCSYIKNMTSLKDLRVMDFRLEHLPNSFEALQTVERLTLKDNDQLETLGSPIGKLRSLKDLRIICCGLQYVNDAIANLKNLETLRLQGNQKLERLCNAFGNLKSLRDLYVVSCGLKCLPDTFSDLDNLEKLTLHCLHGFTMLCSSFGGLKALKELDISMCALTELPESFGNLTCLEKLRLSDLSGLSKLCSSFGGLKALRELDISMCALTELPDSFGNLNCLRQLRLQDNRLTEYPACTMNLVNLRSLDLSNRKTVAHGNRIKDIPSDFQKTCLDELILRGNPITVPPEGVWKQGVNAIKWYMKDITAQDEPEFRPDTINMLGESMAGKTTIALSLVNGLPNAVDIEDRTRVMQQRKLEIDPGSSVIINDFGGHPIYQSVISIFLPFTGLSIVAYNLEEERDKQERHVEKWLLTAIAKSTRIRIVVAGTRSDLFSPEKCLTLKEQMKSFGTDVLKNLKLNIEKAISAHDSLNDERYHKLISLSLKLQDAEIAYETVSYKQSGDFAAFRQVIIDRLQPPERMPSRWLLVMKDILNIQKSGFPCHTMSEVEAMYKKHIDDDPEHSRLPTILRYLTNSSQILWLEKNEHLKDYVFYSPQMIVDKCKDVLHHDESSMGLSRLYNHDVELYNKGRLTMKLLKKLLEKYGDEEREVFSNFLKYFNLVSELKSTSKTEINDRMFAMAVNLSREKPTELPEAEARLRRSDPCVSVYLYFVGSIIPLSFFETSLLMIVTKIHALFKNVLIKQWQDGLLIMHDCEDLIMRRQKADEKIILTAGSFQKKSPWQILSKVLTLLRKNIDDSWPGVFPKWVILCPECKKLNSNGEERVEGEATLDFEECTAHSTERKVSESSRLPFEGCGHLVPRAMCYPISQDPEQDSEISHLKCKLQQARPTLVKGLDSSSINHIIDVLMAAQRGRGLISGEEAELIMAGETVEAKARRLLNAIHKRGDDAIKVLVKALLSDAVGRGDLAALLFGEDYEGKT